MPRRADASGKRRLETAPGSAERTVAATAASTAAATAAATDTGQAEPDATASETGQGGALDSVPRLVAAAEVLRDEVDALRFSPPVTHVYNPLNYAWEGNRQYLERFGRGPKRIVFLGMNPGPFGMMQTGVPFGEVTAVRDWMGIEAEIQPPALQHPKRPIEGFDCRRSEVSGRRLWSWAALRYGSAERFFADAFVLNYCPLVFLEASCRNRTPEQLPAAELRPLIAACDRHLAACIEALQPQWLIGIGGFAEKRLRRLVEDGALDSALARRLQVGQILHPSPASPAANRGWIEAVDERMKAYGLG
jgi:single-strand selective monofunctional uracil DNA glycosylase